MPPFPKGSVRVAAPSLPLWGVVVLIFRFLPLGECVSCYRLPISDGVGVSVSWLARPVRRGRRKEDGRVPGPGRGGMRRLEVRRLSDIGLCRAPRG